VRRGSEGGGRQKVEQDEQGVRAWIQSVRCGESAGRRRADGKEVAGRCGVIGRSRAVEGGAEQNEQGVCSLGRQVEGACPDTVGQVRQASAAGGPER